MSSSLEPYHGWADKDSNLLLSEVESLKRDSSKVIQKTSCLYKLAQFVLNNDETSLCINGRLYSLISFNGCREWFSIALKNLKSDWYSIHFHTDRSQNMFTVRAVCTRMHTESNVTLKYIGSDPSTPAFISDKSTTEKRTFDKIDQVSHEPPKSKRESLTGDHHQVQSAFAAELARETKVAQVAADHLSIKPWIMEQCQKAALQGDYIARISFSDLDKHCALTRSFLETKGASALFARMELCMEFDNKRIYYGQSDKDDAKYFSERDERYRDACVGITLTWYSGQSDEIKNLQRMSKEMSTMKDKTKVKEWVKWKCREAARKGLNSVFLSLSQLFDEGFSLSFLQSDGIVEWLREQGLGVSRDSLVVIPECAPGGPSGDVAYPKSEGFTLSW